MNKKLKRILIIVGIIAIGGVIYRVAAGKKESTEVTTEKSTFRDITETVSASGKIQPESEVKIQSEVSGQIVELPVKEGDLVQKGQLLVKINPDLYTSAYNRAEAALNSSKSNLSSAKARLTQAEAQFNATNLNYQRQKNYSTTAQFRKQNSKTVRVNMKHRKQRLKQHEKAYTVQSFPSKVLWQALTKQPII